MLTAASQKLRRASATNAKKDKLIESLRAENASLKAGSLKRKSGRYFSPEGGLQLALRQSASLAAAYSIGIAAGLDVHGINPLL
jgi:hypothetical protein